MKPPILPFCLAALVLASCAADDPRAEGLNVRAPYGSVAGQGAVASGSPGSSYSNMGRQSLAQGQPERAAYQFEEALKVNPFDPVALNNLAVAKAEQEDYHTAVDLLSRAARLAPDDVEIAANLARLRNWVNSEALSGVDSEDWSGQADLSALPPPPPDLWNPQVYR
ncbi:tetratricopeptide repeat protein [Algiphilus sp. W345]|uniref:Tetratricopeptide repeat protein n=1 Tax=Banduia mediterranea TaxID=3075609 RepID=A0ABU2WJD2_9GAMM|nr:tetratricopeptide repeat protein [Algiphilus sp. W345]MDT0497349.1 tetratricopeptide repeat protein [Algiphilus sp. W345]